MKNDRILLANSLQDRRSGGRASGTGVLPFGNGPRLVPRSAAGEATSNSPTVSDRSLTPEETYAGNAAATCCECSKSLAGNQISGKRFNRTFPTRISNIRKGQH